MKKFEESDRYDYPFTEKSIVIDCGGHRGDFAAGIYDRYGCTIYVLEPVFEFRKIISERFKDHTKYPRIVVLETGIAGSTRPAKILLQDNASGEFAQGPAFETVQLTGIAEFLARWGLGHVDLLKLNVEGTEYEVLEAILDKELVNRFDNIQVQPHWVVRGSEVRWVQIQDRMDQTHELTFRDPGVWYNWRKRGL